MATSADHPQTPAERLISVTIQSTWALWLVGGLYIAGPALGWILALMAARELYLAPGLAPANRPPQPGLVIQVWLAAMLVMLVVLWIGHSNFNLGAAKTIKSSIGWAKGWALIALFPFAASVLHIRAEYIYRAICKLGLQTLIILPVFIAAPFIGLPDTLWVSPLQILGGAGSEYFAATLYTIEPGAGTPRWQFFAPWSPAAGMIAVVYVVLAAQERHLGWKVTGIIAGLALAVLSQSRLALVAIILIVPVLYMLGRTRSPALWMAAVPAVLLAGLFGPVLIELADQIMSDFRGARADSSRVREALGRIAIERWENEAPWFGHGVVENGPHMVEYMPIGSHHSWYGLLFVKGLVGALALAVPLALSVIVLAAKGVSDALPRTAFGMVLVLVLYSFGENLEILSYLYWPALIVIGLALKAPPSRAH
ncbi:O-antigen ligase family protein [Pontixanthobacter sp.]|uniref:O-antigen ligase family protein n=1 Tax=Pontixanthobacter sp. TaxID=2792078 RepID=UPI003C7AD6C0